MRQKILVITCVVIALALFLITVRGEAGNPVSEGPTKDISYSPGPFESSHERAPYALTVSLAKNGRFDLTKGLADFASPDTVSVDGRYYIIFPPGMSLLILPAYRLGASVHMAQLVTYGSMAIVAVLNLLVLYYIGKKILELSTPLALFGALTFGFATTAWSYATSLYQHQTSTFLMLSSFIAIWKFKQNGHHRWLWTIWVWISFGCALWLDYPSLALMMPIGIYLLVSMISWKTVTGKLNVAVKLMPMITALLFLAIVAAHGYYNQHIFGSWKQLAQLLPRYDTKIINETKSIEKKKEIAKSESDKQIGQVLQERMIVNGFYTLTVAPDKGMFFFSPILLLAIPGISVAFRKLQKKQIETVTLVFLAILNIFFYSSWGDPWGGWAYGPRYIIPAMAILSLFVPVWIASVKRQWWAKIPAAILLMYSAGIAALGAVTTTATPPKVEADYLHLKYGYFLNWDMLFSGKTSAYFFTHFLNGHITLPLYAILLTFIVVLAGIWLLFASARKTNART